MTVEALIIYTWRYSCWALSSCRCYCWCCWYFFDWDFAWTNVAFLLFLFEMLFVGLVFGKVQSWYLLKKLLFVWFLGLLLGVIGVFILGPVLPVIVIISASVTIISMSIVCVVVYMLYSVILTITFDLTESYPWDGRTALFFITVYVFSGI